MTQELGVEVDCPFTPGMLRKVVHAGSLSPSFVAATKDLAALAEVEVSRERVERWTKRIGEQRVAQVDALADSYQTMPLPERRKSPTDHVPQLACIQMDGGRIQIRERHRAKDKTNKASSHWRETMVGCLLRMTSAEHTEDPCPIIPKTFVDPERMSELGREIKGFSSSLETTERPPASPATSPDDHAEKPKLLVRSVIATRQGSVALGKRLVAAAYQRGFSAAPKKAFVADGSATNWGVHERHFSDYTPILDFTHAVCYIWAAALAGRSIETAWFDYVAWAQLLWGGEVNQLIAVVAQRLDQLGAPTDDDENSPSAVVVNTLRYLKNQQSRMKYAEYRRAGLPITSSHIESTIKQINRRVKGTEKFWDQGAEPILQLAADHISETNDLHRFWNNRHQQLEYMRCYRTAA